MSASAPSSAATCSVPETMYPRCAVSQLSPPTNGLMHSDHRNPGSACNRFTVTVPRCTTDAVALVGVCISSGLSMLLVSMLAMPLRSPPALPPSPCRDPPRVIFACQGGFLEATGVFPGRILSDQLTCGCPKLGACHATC